MNMSKFAPALVVVAPVISVLIVLKIKVHHRRARSCEQWFIAGGKKECTSPDFRNLLCHRHGVVHGMCAERSTRMRNSS